MLQQIANRPIHMNRENDSVDDTRIELNLLFGNPDLQRGSKTMATRLAERRAVLVRTFATTGAEVFKMGGGTGSSLLSRIGVADFTQQVAQVEDLFKHGKRFPDFLGIWIGHNNIDWVKGEAALASLIKDKNATEEERQSAMHAHFMIIRQKFADKMYEQLYQLLLTAQSKAELTGRRSAITVYGLINFKSFFDARKDCESDKKSDDEKRTAGEDDPEHEDVAERFPFLKKSEEIFQSMQELYRPGMIELAHEINQDLKAIVTDLAWHFALATNLNISGYRPPTDSLVFLGYSPALSEGIIGECKYLSSYDAWHPSVEKVKLISNYTYDGAQSGLKFIDF
jgi:hypothetical protein